LEQGRFSDAPWCTSHMSVGKSQLETFVSERQIILRYLFLSSTILWLLQIITIISETRIKLLMGYFHLILYIMEMEKEK